METVPDINYINYKNELKIIVDETLDFNSSVNEDLYLKKKIVSLGNIVVIKKLTGSTFSSLAKHFISLEYSKYDTFFKDGLAIDIYLSEVIGESTVRISVKFEIDKYEKLGPVNFFIDKLKSHFPDKKLYFAKLNDFIILIFEFQHTEDLSVCEVVDSMVAEIIIRFQETEKEIMENMYSNSVTAFFRFPDEIKTSCKQYLIYFNQFLMDLGIKAEVDLLQTSISNNFLLKITPENPEEALANVRDALDTFIFLPGNTKGLNRFEPNDDIAVQQLKANILHLESQIQLAGAVLEGKDSNIQLLQITNYQLSKLLELDVKQASKEEPLISGVLNVKKYDGKFFTLDLPNILKRLKRKR
jgi:hypothetical protein